MRRAGNFIEIELVASIPAMVLNCHSITVATKDAMITKKQDTTGLASPEDVGSNVPWQGACFLAGDGISPYYRTRKASRSRRA